MDPNANLAGQRRLATAIIRNAERGIGSAHTSAQLAEHVQALDEWITRGGFLPAAWASAQAKGGE